MALKDFFKKRKTAKEKKEVKKPKEKKEELATLKKEKKEVKGEAFCIFKAPHITEKATDLVKENQYVFKVFPKSNKTEIKKAIEDLYGVDVISVKIIKTPKKERRLGRISGWKKGYKKAIIKIKEGQKIEIVPR